MSFLFQNYKRLPIEFIKAEGNYLIDCKGDSYLDFSSGIGVTNLGFHPQVESALLKQAKDIWHMPNLYSNLLQEKVAQALIGDSDYLAFFCNSGTEANEAAIKLARKATGKQGIISFTNSFHGRSYGSMSATGQDKIKEGFGEGVPHFSYATYNDLDSVKKLVNDDTAAVMLELIQGESGIRPAHPEFITALSNFCKEHNLLLIVDEVQTGIGRTGKLYAFEHYDIVPDIVTLAKGLANGVPVGAMLGKRNLASAFSYGSHGSTFGGNKLAMAAALETIKIIKHPEFIKNIEEKSHYLMKELKIQLKDISTISDIRGIGFMIGIETSQNLYNIVDSAREKGLVILTAGSDVIRLLPPLTLTKEEIDKGVAILKEVFEVVEE